MWKTSIEIVTAERMVDVTAEKTVEVTIQFALVYMEIKSDVGRS